MGTERSPGLFQPSVPSAHSPDEGERQAGLRDLAPGQESARGCVGRGPPPRGTPGLAPVSTWQICQLLHTWEPDARGRGWDWQGLSDHRKLGTGQHSLRPHLHPDPHPGGSLTPTLSLLPLPTATGAPLRATLQEAPVTIPWI